MKYLLDTQIVLWTLFKSKRLKKNFREPLLNINNEIYVSPMSFWEISLKYSLGKISLGKITPDQLPEYVSASGMKVLEMDVNNLASFHRLPRLDEHKDPFDRMIIWQAINNNYTLISSDRSFEKYKASGLKLIS